MQTALHFAEGAGPIFCREGPTAGWTDPGQGRHSKAVSNAPPLLPLVSKNLVGAVSWGGVLHCAFSSILCMFCTMTLFLSFACSCTIWRIFFPEPA